SLLHRPRTRCRRAPGRSLQGACGVAPQRPMCSRSQSAWWCRRGDNLRYHLPVPAMGHAVCSLLEVCMNRRELVNAIAAHTGQNSKDVDATLTGFTDVVQAVAAKGEPVVIS